MSVNIGNNEAEQFSNYRKTIDGIDDKGNSDGSSYEVPEDITSDEDEDIDTDELDTEAEDEIEEEEFKEEVNHNFPLSGGGTPLDV